MIPRSECPICHKNEASYHPTLGVLPCLYCGTDLSGLPRPNRQVEFTTDSIRQGRKEYARDVIQPFRQGELSKEYLEAYGDSRIKVTEKEKAKAKNVWKADTEYYKD